MSSLCDIGVDKPGTVMFQELERLCEVVLLTRVYVGIPGFSSIQPNAIISVSIKILPLFLQLDYHLSHNHRASNHLIFMSSPDPHNSRDDGVSSVRYRNC